MRRTLSLAMQRYSVQPRGQIFVKDYFCLLLEIWVKLQEIKLQEPEKLHQIKRKYLEKGLYLQN